MLKHLLLLFSLSLWMHAAFAQTKSLPFTLEGTINTDSGTVELAPIGSPAYYPFRNPPLKAAVEKGKFLIKGFVLYPLAYRILLDKRGELVYLSDFFLIDPGFQTIRCNVDSLRESPLLVNFSRQESKDYNEQILAPVNYAIDQTSENQDRLRTKYGDSIPDSFRVSYENKYQTLQREKNTGLLRYTISHPGSYVALWELIKYFQSRYEPMLDSVYLHFSDSIKSSFTGKVLAEKLNGARTTAIGKSFPGLSVLSPKSESMNVPVIDKSDKYILIDFWFSHCGPCISQFEVLKELFTAYHEKGFDIQGVSTDDEKQLANWKTVIQKYRLPWKQFRDAGGKETDKLGIAEFPTNFLLDANGKIIARDLAPVQLKSFLEKNLL